MTSTVQTDRKSFLRRRWVKVTGGAVILICLFFLLLPFGVKYYLISWLEENGADSAKIESLWFNPFTGRVTLGKLDVRRGGKSLLSHSDITLDIGIQALFQRDFRIESAKYENLVLDLEQYKDGRWRFGSYTVAGDERQEVKPKTELPDSTSWGVLADRVVLSKCRLKLKTAQYKVDFFIDHAELKKFTTHTGERAGKFVLTGSLNGAGIEIKLDTLKVAPQLEISGDVHVKEFDLDNLSLLLADALQSISGKVGVNGKLHLTAGDDVLVDYDGTITVTDPVVGNSAFSVQGGQLNWRGKTHYAGPAEGDMAVDLDGLLASENFSFQLPDGEFRLQEKKIGIEGKSKIRIGDDVRVESDASIHLQATDCLLPSLKISNDSLQWRGKVDYTTADSNKKLPAAFDGQIVLDGFSLFDGKGQTPMVAFENVTIDDLGGSDGRKLTIGSLAMTDFSTSVQGEMPLDISVAEVKLHQVENVDFKSLKAEELSVLQPVVQSTINGRTLVKAGEIRVTGIMGDLEKTGFSSRNIFLDGLVFLDAVSLEKGNLSSPAWAQDSGVSGETLSLENLLATINLDKKGELNINRQLQAMRQAPQETEGNTGEAAGVDKSDEPYPFILGKLELIGKNRLSFTDNTLAVPFTSELVLSKLELGRLDSTRPEQKTTLVLQGEFEGRAPLSVKGELFPFKPSPALDLDIELKNYPLTKLSSYTVQSVGTALAGGQLQLKTKLGLADEILNMQNDILLKKLETERISEELATELDNELPIPLDAALAMLRDSKDNISLDIPIEGPLSDLDVGISDILVTALGKAIVPAASSYLVYSLGPYAALAYVGMKVGEKMMQVELPPVNFELQEITLTPEHADYLKRIGQILKDRPKTDLQLCPVVASREFLSPEVIASEKKESIEVAEQDREKLLALGEQRATAVQDYLVKTFGVEKSRLLICDTKIDTGREAVPKVLLQL
ncbi:DUF748 domain-containing protein [Desulfomarina profundi]|uniref:DUF748 domain-containing protein n=1 Tax=Desulfomarina profundi TaxID=2772557 RepID=UPI001E3301EC|nr:DUF748 domain-containing protein [Desulfomarina profundi]